MDLRYVGQGHELEVALDGGAITKESLLAAEDRFNKLHDQLFGFSPDGEPAVFTGKIDRIDRLPEGGIEVIDYKTGKVESQKGVQESLQLSIYALACRDALGLGTPEKVTLYFTEAATRMSTTRTDEQLDAARDALVAWAQRVRAGDFAATPSSNQCWRCDYGPICPERMR
jgi:RecB family exonuclease